MNLPKITDTADRVRRGATRGGVPSRVASAQAGGDHEGPDHRDEVARRFTEFVRSVADGGPGSTGSPSPPTRPLPLPGSGETWERWKVLAETAEHDLALGRLAEGHADALAIIAEVGGEAPSVPDGARWGVWAAEPPGSRLAASSVGGRWAVHGLRRYCSGAFMCTHAVVTADAPDGPRLFTVDLAQSGCRPVPGSWPAVGMAASETLDVRFDEAAAEPLGPVGAYLGRPGFHHGGAGVAAVWWGGANAVARPLYEAGRAGRLDAHGPAHLGAVDIALTTARTVLHQAADEIDADPHDHDGAAETRALRVRAVVEKACAEVLEHVGRALGAGPLCHDARHARAVADLTVYVRQHHAERDLARLGSLAAEGDL
ncbi:acyl-CoA dehydrogenase [Streptodolium elevatio]|uniref:Acyl-CoA dehydrogenase n=1 Tax=Streptodolium elevatio TaxID=3157996 RepID=A0ABV3DLC9_9ACTN